MKMHSHVFLVGVLLITIGCGSRAVPVAEAPPPEEKHLVLEIVSDASVADLLGKPRAELAALADEWADRLRVQEKAYREGKTPFVLLPEARLPLVLPIWRQARFSASAGISLPPYLADGAKDGACAVHLARYGDVVAARLLADDSARPRIEALQAEKNYPAEWTRLVALMLHGAQYRLAAGDPTGAGEILALHRQLIAILDVKAAAGPLGADLLSRGHFTLTRAAKAWREAKNVALAQQVETALADWGKVPAPTYGLAPGAPRAEAAPVLGTTGQGRLAVPPLLRGLDLLALPFPNDGIQGVFVFFDSADKFSDVVITYRARLGDTYPEPGQLALRLEDHAPASADGPLAAGVRERTYLIGPLACAVAVLPHCGAAGAWVRFSDPRPGTQATRLDPDFGALHLDATFARNRQVFAPEQSGDLIEVSQRRARATIRDPLHRQEWSSAEPPFVLHDASARREPGSDLLARLTLRYAVERENVTLPEIARPLWTAYGPGRLAAIESPQESHLGLVWEDAKIRYLLTLPSTGSTLFELQAVDRRGPDQLTERTRAAEAFDQAERQARVQAGKALVRLPRHLEDVALGMTIEQVRQALPARNGTVHVDMPGGLRMVFTGAPAKEAGAVPRELFVRFDPSGKAREVRARYEDGPAGGVQALLNAIRKRAGAPWEQAAPWGAFWGDLPPRKPAATQYAWQDDLTRLTLQRDAGGAEAVLTDHPLGQPTPMPPRPLEYLARGPDGVSLGEMRGELRRWEIAPSSARPDGSVALTPAKAGPYDGILVWFDKDRVARIVARHTADGSSPTRAADMSHALKQSWAREGPQLGWPRRQDANAEGLLQSLGWHDDRTRVRLSWQEGSDGTPRLFTEWKSIGE